MHSSKSRAAVAQGLEHESRLPLAACQSVLEQDTEPQDGAGEQLAPCMAASAISVWMWKYL